jgi:hypothetical protein
MAKFNAPKRLVVEDFPQEQRPWIGKLFDQLNIFMEQVTRTLVQGIVLADNFKGLVVPLNVSINQSYPMKQNIVALKDRPSSVHIGYITPTDQSTMAAAFSVAWIYDNGVLSFRLIGLDASKSYKGTLIVLV